MRNAIQSLDSKHLFSNFDKHPAGHSFTSRNTLIASSLIAMPDKLCLPTNFLKSPKTTVNNHKLSRDYFEDQSLADALKSYIAKQIIDTASIRDIYTISHDLANNDRVARQLAELTVLLEKKEGEIMASSVYTQKDGLFWFLF